MRCPRCKSDIDYNQNFCQDCGYTLNGNPFPETEDNNVGGAYRISSRTDFNAFLGDVYNEYREPLQQNEQSYRTSASSMGFLSHYFLYVIVLCFPIIGVIFYFVWKNQYVKRARVIGIITVVSFVFWVIAAIYYVLVSVGTLTPAFAINADSIYLLF